jgi:hypothetical protein
VIRSLPASLLILSLASTGCAHLIIPSFSPEGSLRHTQASEGEVEGQGWVWLRGGEEVYRPSDHGCRGAARRHQDRKCGTGRSEAIKLRKASGLVSGQAEGLQHGIAHVFRRPRPIAPLPGRPDRLGLASISCCTTASLPPMLAGVPAPCPTRARRPLWWQQVPLARARAATWSCKRGPIPALPGRHRRPLRRPPCLRARPGPSAWPRSV